MKWISVYDRLPDVDQRYSLSKEVLVTVEDVALDKSEWGNFAPRFVYTAVINHNGVWLHSWDHGIIEKDKDTFVIGWTPMPEPMNNATN